MSVRQEDGRVWIDGVAGFTTGEYASSPHGCQARILQVLDEPLSYADLLIYGGFAFRISVHEALCPSAGHPCCGCMCVEGATRALPWHTRLFECFPWADPKADPAAFEAEACAAIRASIDRGVPVHYGSEEDGLIIGYADEGRRWWCLHPYHYAAIATLGTKGLSSTWDLALPPNQVAQWSPELRQNQMARLEAARTHDQAAIVAITQALTILS